jgi:hypothetical protein
VALPEPIDLVLVPAQPITPGLPNQGGKYNDNLQAHETSLEQLAEALRGYSGLPVIRTINDLEPDEDGNYVIPKTVLVEALTTVQRDAIPPEGRVIGRLVYNTTRRVLEVYGNNGWQAAGEGASTALTITRVAGIPTRMVETRPDASQRLALLRYSNDRLVSVTRYNPSAVDTLTYDGAGRFTGFTTA